MVTINRFPAYELRYPEVTTFAKRTATSSSKTGSLAAGISTAFSAVLWPHLRRGKAFTDISSLNPVRYQVDNATKGLSVFEFTVHNDFSSSPPDWLPSLFGNEAVWYNESINHFFVADPLSPDEIRHRNVTERRMFATDLLPLPTDTQCAIEMLGFVELNIDEPYMHDSFKTSALYGTADLRLDSYTDSSYQSHWRCVSRALNENWRQEPWWLRSYWTMIFLCPCPYATQDDAVEPPSQLRAELTAFGRRKAFQINFLLHRVQQAAKPANNKRSIPEPQNRDTNLDNENVINISSIAVCSVLPYTSSDTNKIMVNKALLLEWVNYYSHLAMPVILYDRDGSNEKYLRQISRHERKLGNIKKDIIYYDYTVKGLLDRDYGLENPTSKKAS